MAQLKKRYIYVGVGIPGTIGRVWRDLDVSFSVEKNTKKTPNKSKIDIWNLSENSKALFEEDNSVVVLYAGYVPDPPILAIGDIAEVEHKRKDGDVLTNVSSGDGERSFQLSYLNKSFAPKTTNHDILKEVAKATGLGIGYIDEIPEITYYNGYVASGLTRDILDDIVSPSVSSWSVQDNELQILGEDQGTNDQALLLNRKTGLIGTPQLKKSKGKKAKKNSGVKAVSLLNPWLKPGKYIKLESEFINGFFLCKNVTHKGSSFDKTFYSNIEATQVSAKATKTTQSQPTIKITPLPTSDIGWIQSLRDLENSQ